MAAQAEASSTRVIAKMPMRQSVCEMIVGKTLLKNPNQVDGIKLGHTFKSGEE